MANKRSIKVVVAARLVNGVVQGSIDVQDDKGNYLPLTLGEQTGDHLGFTVAGDIGDIISVESFDRAAKSYADARQKAIDEALAAQAAADANAQLPIGEPEGAAPVTTETSAPARK